ncbi:hypothetical protein MO867_12015 [Microbulbifer sp. OS29]|uniref:Uncharacterized protein n=1 Tax=Microbulbifer okhotskensis TaxID=2926617 RepID=A0A9X2EPP8_9GAMM|nr:hypothetical protein [Microbulbifer okhotskensis]MCO1335060.1 hypothetical protein [Microbulbifer okhotskensis]
MPFSEFWPWLAEHTNCIVRAGSSDSVIYDDDDYHWRFASEDTRTKLVQVMRGKRPVAELFIEPEHISSVRISLGEGGEFNFDLIADIQGREQIVYHFVLTHALEEMDVKSHPVQGKLH